MAYKTYECCGECGRVIEKNEPVVRVKLGRPLRRESLFRYRSILFRAIEDYHLRCIDEGIDYDDKNPQLALKEVLEEHD